MAWLKEYCVPIDFIPFSLHAASDSDDIILEIARLPEVPFQGENTEIDKWQGDWFFNTNETNSPSAYKEMFEHSVIAIYGYETGPDNLTGSAKGDRVFAYVSGKGVLAVGSIFDGQVVPGSTVFGENHEFHVKVDWETIVDDDRAVTQRDVIEKKSYNLPVRCVFARMYRHDAADWIADELLRRSGQS